MDRLVTTLSLTSPRRDRFTGCAVNPTGLSLRNADDFTRANARTDRFRLGRSAAGRTLASRILGLAHTLAGSVAADEFRGRIQRPKSAASPAAKASGTTL